MSILVSVHQLSQSFSARPLFKKLTFSIESGERIGLIGPNGAGKSTLLRLIAGQITPDEGTLSFQRGLKVGFLEQVPRFSAQSTILSTLLEVVEDPLDWENLALADEFISKLHLDRFSSDQSVEQLSGGWKKRVALGRALMCHPDLLLLDEPTNHLDVESILWLEEFLSRVSFSTLTITHDRLFLQRVSNRILELDPRNVGGLLSVQGDYASYLEVKESLMQAQERREVILKNTLRRETEWLRQGAKARTTKQEARIQRAGQLKEDVEELSTRNLIRSVKIDFDTASKNPKKLIDVKGISKSYAGQIIFSDLNLMITSGSRMGLLGANGMGKSTLIRVLLGIETPDQGEILRADNLSVAYFDQSRDTLDPNQSVSKTLCPSGDYVDFRGTRVHIRSYLDRFLFTQGQMDMSIGKLSGGEQSRLLIARLMLKEANLLVLDEPTNDLDMATLNVLEECLIEFNGAIVLVTHDRYFLDQVANQILAFSPSQSLDQSRKLIPFSSYSQWEKWYDTLEKSQTKNTAVSHASVSPSSQAETACIEKKKKRNFKEQHELDTMEKRIHEAETLLARLTLESALPEIMSNATKLTHLMQAMSQAQSEIEQLYRRWEVLEETKI